MIQVASHIRKRKNGASVIRKHSRVSVISKDYHHRYDEKKQKMTATFPGGAQYHYHDVTPREYKAVQKDKFGTLAKFKKSKKYSPANETAKAHYTSPTAKKKRAALYKTIKTTKK